MASLHVCNAQLTLAVRRCQLEETALVTSKLSWSHSQVIFDVNGVRLSAIACSRQPRQKEGNVVLAVLSEGRRSSEQRSDVKDVSHKYVSFFASAQAAILSLAGFWSTSARSASKERLETVLKSISILTDQIQQLQERMARPDRSPGLMSLKPAKELQSQVATLADRAILLKCNAQRCLSNEGCPPVQVMATFQSLRREHQSLENILRLAASGMGPHALLQPGGSNMPALSMVPAARSAAVTATEVSGVTRSGRGSRRSKLTMKRTRSAADVRCKAMVNGRTAMGVATAGIGGLQRKPLYNVSSAAMKACPSIGGFSAEIERRVRETMGRHAHVLHALPKKAEPIRWSSSEAVVPQGHRAGALGAGRRGGRGGRGRGGARPPARILGPRDPLLGQSEADDSSVGQPAWSSSEDRSAQEQMPSNGSLSSRPQEQSLAQPSGLKSMRSEVGKLRTELVRAKSAMEVLREAREVSSAPRLDSPDYSDWSVPDSVGSPQGQITNLTSQLAEKDAQLTSMREDLLRAGVPPGLPSKPAFYGRAAIRTATQADADIVRKDAELGALRRQLAESQAEKRRLEQRAVRAELGEGTARRQLQEIASRLDSVKQMLRRGKASQAMQRVSTLLRQATVSPTPAGEHAAAGVRIVKTPAVYNPQIAHSRLGKGPVALPNGAAHLATTSWWTTSLPKKDGSWTTFGDGEELNVPVEVPADRPEEREREKVAAEEEKGEDIQVEVVVPAEKAEDGVGPIAAPEWANGAVLEEVVLESPVEEEEAQAEEAPMEEPEPEVPQNDVLSAEPSAVEEVSVPAVETRQEHTGRAGPCITLHYVTGWDTAYLHFCSEGSGWTDLPGLPMQSTPGDDMEARVKVMSVEGEYLEFVVTDGCDNWDKAPWGGNYIITKSGKYILQNGEIQELAGSRSDVSPKAFGE